MLEMRLSSTAVAATEVSVTFGSTVALAPSTFAIPREGITAVIGPNGSGKSTLLNLIAGLLEASSGRIEVSSAGQRRIAYVLQSTKVNDVLPITVREVVTMGRYAEAGAYGSLGESDHNAIDLALERMGVTELGDRHLRDLSGGQRQRVFVAQGLAQEHDFLLLDEPLTGLDIISAQSIDDVIHEERAEGCTIIMTTHDLAEAHVADYVVLLSGFVVASGKPGEVLTVENLTKAYGPNLLHVEGRQLFLDDPAHSPSQGRHSHRDRSS